MTLRIAVSLLLAAVALSACGTKSYTGSRPWKESDKHLNCEQLLLEINDARYWQTIAQGNKKAGVTDFIWPVGYIGTYSSAEEAIQSTQLRIEHLSNIYQIKGCNKPYPDTPAIPPEMN